MAEQHPSADADELLSPLKAAHHLGITPELLFSYTRARFGKSKDQRRRLATVQRNGATLFRVHELAAFDDYLKQPWADLGAERSELPQCIVDHLRAESGNQCIRCGSGIGVQTAHIAPWATSRSHYHHNLIRICSACHSEHDAHNSLTSEELLALKQRGIAGTRATLEIRLASISGTGRRPALDRLFVGRSQLLQELREALQESRAVQIRGPGGIGKTQLLLHAIEGLDVGRKLIWLEVERYRSTSDLRAALEVAARHGAAREAAAGTLAQCLDAVHACVVLDGVEQLRGAYLDGLDDLILELQGATVFAQYVVTTQVDLQRALFNAHIELLGLERDAGEALVSQMLRHGTTATDSQSVSALLTLADGHPLTLRLVGVLANHFKSTRLALLQIERRGVRALEVPKRAKQDRGTCLHICLSLAYEALDADEGLLAYLMANAPGGLYSALIESDRWLGARGRSAIAGLQRWSFIQALSQDEGGERLSMLSPVALYVEERWRDDLPERASSITTQLVEEFAIMAVVIQERSNLAGVNYMTTRFAEELPNLLRVLDVAEARPADAASRVYVPAMCRGLMGFFFVLNLPEPGAQVMLRGARICIRDGHLKQATDLLVQAVSLAGRNRNIAALEAAERMLSALSGDIRDADAETRGNVEQVLSMFACVRGQATRAEAHAKRAISLFEAALAPQNDCSDDVHNDLSASFGLLGHALLSQRRFEPALSAYQTALSHLRGDSAPVNAGQIHHQLGNCESGLNQHVRAARCYLKAAAHFHHIGMREFLGNATSELGHTLLDAAGEGLAPELPLAEVVTGALDDVSHAVAQCFTSATVDRESYRLIIRKLFGVIVVASLSESAGELAEFAHTIQGALVDGGTQGSQRSDAAVHIAALCRLATTVAMRERHLDRDLLQPDIQELASACCAQGPSPDLQRDSFRWLALYLRRRWSMDVSPGALRRAADLAHAGHPFRLP